MSLDIVTSEMTPEILDGIKRQKSAIINVKHIINV